MKVRVLRNIAITPEQLRRGEQQLLEGHEYDLDEERAEVLIEQGQAELTGAKAERHAKAEAEKAAKEFKGPEIRSEFTGPERQNPPHTEPTKANKDAAKDAKK